MKDSKSIKTQSELAPLKATWRDWKKIILTKKQAHGMLETQKILREVRGR